MATIGRFSLAVPHIEGEPAHGYMLRLATRYEVPPARLAARIGVTMGGLARGVGLDRLAAAARVDADALAAWSPVVRTRDRRVALRGEGLMLGDWSVSTRRWCPTCLAEDAAQGVPDVLHRSWWDVISIGVCPVHLCLMEDACGHCGLQTSWRRPAFARCRCGAAYASTTAVSVPERDGMMARHVAARLGSPSEGGHSDCALPLDRLPGFAERLGSALRGDYSPRRPGLDPIGLQRDRSAGLAALPDVEARFETALNATAQGREGRPAGLIGGYGWVYSRWLCLPEQDLTGGTLVETMRRHAVSSGIIAGDEPVLGGVAAPGLTLTAAADRLGFGFSRTRRILVSGDMIGAGLRRGVAAAITPSAVAAVEARLRSRLTGTAAAALLGIGRKTMRDLGRTEVLREEEGSYDEEEVRSLTLRLSSGPSPAGRLTSLIDQARGGGTTVAQLCRALLDGRAKAALVERGSMRLRDVWMEAAAVENRRRDGPCTVRGIARRLGVHEDAVRQLAPLGVLSDTAAADPTASGVALFHADFVTPAELARVMGSNAKTVRLSLERLGLNRAFGPPVCRQIFYRRRDAEALLPLIATGRSDAVLVTARAH